MSSKYSFISFLSVAEFLIIITKSDVDGPLESSPFLLLASAHKASLQLLGLVLSFMLTTEQTVAIVRLSKALLPCLQTQQISSPAPCLCSALVWGAEAYLESPRKNKQDANGSGLRTLTSGWCLVSGLRTTWPGSYCLVGLFSKQAGVRFQIKHKFTFCAETFFFFYQRVLCFATTHKRTRCLVYTRQLMNAPATHREMSFLCQ